MNAETAHNLDPRPRNPLIAKVFREIHFSDQLGSGMRRLYHDVPLYSGFAKPQFLDGNVFRLIVPLNDEVPSASEMDYPQKEETAQKTTQETNEGSPKGSPKSSPKILELIKANPSITTQQIADRMGISKRAVLKNLTKMKDKVIHKGPSNGGHWEIVDDGE